MNLKPWVLAGAVAASVAISLAGSKWYAVRGKADKSASAGTSLNAATRELVKAHGVYAWPYVDDDRKSDNAAISGRWIGEVDLGAGPIQFTFDLHQNDGRLVGNVIIPIGTADIVDGKVDGNDFSFTTQHRLPSTDKKLVVSYIGSLANNDILLMTNGDITANLTLKRTAY